MNNPEHSEHYWTENSAIKSVDKRFMLFNSVPGSFDISEPILYPNRSRQNLVSRFAVPKLKLTARFVDAIKVEVRTDFHDTVVHGLSLRVAPTGTKTWNLFYWRASDSTNQRVKLGRYPTMDLESARTAALKAMSAAAEGNDPAEAKRSRRAALTVGELGALFLERHSKRNKKTWREDERILEREVYPRIGRMKAEDVRRRDVLEIIEAKAGEGKGAQSRNILATVRKMFNWAVDSDYLSSSPVAGVKPRAKAGKRDRVLSEAEIRAILKALPAAGLSWQMRSVIELLFLTGQRSGEVCGITRSEIDLDAMTWTIPGRRVKNALTHVVPLSPLAAEILTHAVANSDPDNQDPPLFTKTGQPIESNAVAQAVRLKLQIVDEHWTPHDIRRTVATGMGSLGVYPHVVEAVLNHISGAKAGVAGIYNRAKYEPEKREALNLWAERLAQIVDGP